MFAARDAERLAGAVALTAALAVPLLFVPTTENVFEPAKAALVRWLGLTAWVFVAAASSDREVRRIWGRALRSPLFMAMAGVWCSGVAATLLGTSPQASLTGSYSRGLGLVTDTAIFGLALAAFFLAYRGGAVALAAGLGVGAGAAALYGVLQFETFGLDPLPWDGDVRTRIAGPAGNSVLFAAHLAMALPFAVALCLRVWRAVATGEARPIALGAWIASLVLGMVGVLLSASRGPALGLTAGAVLVLAAATATRAGISTRRVTLAVGLGLLLVGGVLVTSGAGRQAVERLPMLERLTSALDPEASAARVRLRLWRGSVDRLANSGARILVGYGPESMDLVWAPYYPPILAYDEPRGSVPDRAHNATFDLMLTGGALGWLAWHGLVAAALATALGLAGLGGRPVLVAALVAGVAGAVVAAGVAGAAGVGLGWGGGAAGGALLGLALAGRGRPPQPNPAGFTDGQVIGLACAAVLVAHFVEVQVGFESVVTRLQLWLVCGLLLGLTASVLDDSVRPTARPWPSLALGGALAAGLPLAHAFFRPGLVAGGGVWALVIVFGGTALVATCLAGVPPAAPESLPARANQTSLRNGRQQPGQRPLALAEGLPRVVLALAIFAAGHLAIIRLGATDPGASVGAVTLGLAWLGAGLLAGVWLLANVEPRPGHLGLAALSAALAVAAGAPLVAEAAHKEGRLAWQSLVPEARAEGESGLAEALLDGAALRYRRAAGLAPWEKNYPLALARSETERADVLDERLVRGLANARIGPVSEYDESALDGQAADLARRRDAAFAAALTWARTAEDRGGGHPEPRLTAARIRRVWGDKTRDPGLRSERLAAAVAAYADAAVAAPRWPEVLDEAAWVHLMAQQPESALVLTRQALALDPFFLRAHRTAAIAYAAMGDHTSAVEAYRSYLADTRNASDLAAQRGLLAALSRLGRSEEALAVAGIVLVLAPDDAHSHADMAVLQESTGDRAAALASAKRAAELAPGDGNIEALVKRLESPDGH